MIYSIKFFLIYFLLFMVTGCSSKIDGEVFIVTKGGDSKKLALVDVKAYKVKDVEQFKKSLNLRLAEKIKEKIMADALLNIIDSRFNIHLVNIELSETLIEAFAKVIIEVEPVAAQSDADGKFKMEIPYGDYVIFAVGARQALGEDYLWLMRNTKNGQLRLANDSMYTQGCRDCLLTQSDVLELYETLSSAKKEGVKLAQIATKLKKEELHNQAISEIDPNDQKIYDEKNCRELKKMSNAYPNSLYSQRIEFYIKNKWSSSDCK